MHACMHVCMYACIYDDDDENITNLYNHAYIMFYHHNHCIKFLYKDLLVPIIHLIVMFTVFGRLQKSSQYQICSVFNYLRRGMIGKSQGKTDCVRIARSMQRVGRDQSYEQKYLFAPHIHNTTIITKTLYNIW